jgi:hypothetical protein
MAGYDVTQAPHAPSALSTAYSQPGNANQGPRHVNETKLAEWGKRDNTTMLEIDGDGDDDDGEVTN